MTASRAIIWGAAISVSDRREIAATAGRSDGVVIVFPERQDLAGVRERAEQRFLQQLIPQAAIKAFDEGILQRLAGCNEVPLDPAVLRPA